MPLAYEIAKPAAVQPTPDSHSEVPAASWLVEAQQCKAAERLGTSKPLLREALRQALASPDELELAAEGICGDCKLRMIWRRSIPNFLKPLADHVFARVYSSLLEDRPSLCVVAMHSSWQ
ncbi:unnamed protein product [Polarella glacialis]|uniref:Uncharacterized protein n=1 Tax=Polarella glacialis TaxID=89957 RepID=A0A813HTA7_POLGL|nr:unnamed protein product [Polarella glacialis]CAE8646569.1 unnamed protein product [Polarella glacialis]